MDLTDSLRQWLYFHFCATSLQPFVSKQTQIAHGFSSLFTNREILTWNLNLHNSNLCIIVESLLTAPGDCYTIAITIAILHK